MKNRSVLFGVLGLAVLLAGSGWLYGMHLAGGDFTYPLDDAYIHLQIARNLVESGTWGIERGVPAFASSSPLWTLVLAAFALVFGAAEWLPLVLSYLFAALALVALLRFWREAGVSPSAAAAGGVAFVVFVPFITLANLGMEHALHVCSLVAFLGFAWRCSRSDSRRDFALTLTFAVLAVGARYESLFVVTPVALLFLLPAAAGGFAKPKAGAALMAVQFLPVVALGLTAVACGRPFFPVSLLLKTNVHGNQLVRGLLSLYFGLTRESVHLHVLVGLLLFAAAFRRSPFCAALAVAAVGHGVFARLGWLYRYEAYLVAVAVMALTAIWGSGRSSGDRPAAGGLVSRYSFLLLALALAVPFVARSFNAHYDTVVAEREINAQQKQMGLVFATLPAEQRGPIAVTDLGCVAYFSGVHVLDLWGLGTPEVAAALCGGEGLADGLSALFARHGVRYFALYRGWFDLSKAAPDGRVVATLTLRHRPVICAGNCVVLGVAHAADAPAFREHLRRFSPRLPSEAQLEFTVEDDER